MGTTTRMASCRLALFTALVAGILISGCAQPPPPQVYKSKYKSDFASRLDIQINYHTDPNSGYVVVDLYNPRNKPVRLWLVQLQETDGRRISAAERFHIGNEKKHQELFRVPLLEPGLSETFYVEVFDEAGKLILKSDPITNTSDQ